MECMCPNCGKKLDKGMFVFDVAEIIQRILEKKADESLNIKKLFNYWKNQKMIFGMTEQQLWNCDGQKNGDRKDILFTIPVSNLLERLEEVIKKFKEDEEYINIKNWLVENQSRLAEKSNQEEITLRKIGDGDILFSQLSYDDITIDKRLCPKCGDPLSFYAGRYPEITLTVLGGPRVSKTTALVSCASAFMDGNDSFVQWECWPDDEKSANFKTDLELYRNGKEVKATPVNSPDVIPRMAFKVTTGRKAEDKQSFCLNFIDLPGELNGSKGISPELDKRYKNIFPNIDFIWYCTDPAELMQIAYEETVGKRQVIEKGQMKMNMTTLASYFRTEQHKAAVALIVGKTDWDILGDAKEKYGLFEAGKESDIPFDLDAFYGRGNKARECIKSFARHDLINTFEGGFEKRCYIAMSAYGFIPLKESDRESISPRPYHCKEAMYWMLAQMGHINISVRIPGTNFWGMPTLSVVEDESIEILESHEKIIAYRKLHMSKDH